MKEIRKHLEKLRRIRRKSYHPLVHRLHKKYNSESSRAGT